MTTKAERINLRVSRELKSRVSEAAATAGMSLSAFVTSAAQDAAEQVMRSRPVVMLSDRDGERFLAALDRPARPIPDVLAEAKTRREVRLVD